VYTRQELEQYLTPDKSFSLADNENLYMFKVYDATTGVVLHDPSKIHFFARMVTRDAVGEDQKYSNHIETHKCTSKEIKRMYAKIRPQDRNNGIDTTIKALNSGTFLCLNDKDVEGKDYKLELFGMDGNA
jgi:hypothetical protein